MRIKVVLAMFFALLILMPMVAGCADTGVQSDQRSSPSQQLGQSSGPENSPKGVSAAIPSDSQEDAAYIFTDSCGREVELPRNIERIAPTGPVSQIVLITLCPEKLVGLASFFNDEQFEYMDRKYESLPVLGNFYADTLNLESVMLAAPQVIIDIGETKPNNTDDLDDIQERTGIPTIFVQMELGTMVSAYETLGKLTGEIEQAQKIAGYISQTLTETEQRVKSIPENRRVKVYYGQDDGLSAMVSGTVHTDVIDIVGGMNVVIVEESVRRGISAVSMEQLILWGPDVELFGPGSIFDTVGTQTEWGGIGAIRSGWYYEVPSGPYNWMGRPPSVNRILGIKWLSNLLYPDVFSYDMAEETREFFRLFYHCEVTDEQIDALLARSTFK